MTSDILIFNLWAHFWPKKSQIPQKVIAFLIQNRNQIEPQFLDFRIARWIYFPRRRGYFFRFRTPSGDKLGPKLGTF